MELMKTIIKNEGITSLWNGIGPSLIRVCGGVGIYFSSLELMTSYRNKKNKKLNIIDSNIRKAIRSRAKHDGFFSSSERIMRSWTNNSMRR